jgi:hypothetical protein
MKKGIIEFLRLSKEVERLKGKSIILSQDEFNTVVKNHEYFEMVLNFKNVEITLTHFGAMYQFIVY